MQNQEFSIQSELFAVVSLFLLLSKQSSYSNSQNEDKCCYLCDAYLNCQPEWQKIGK